ncbi:MAG: signal peptidase I [Cyanobacteria bacterium P01_D01_bin.6]
MPHLSFRFVSSLALVLLETAAWTNGSVISEEPRHASNVAQLPPILQNSRAFLEDFEARYTVSSSMEPTLATSDTFIIDKHTYRSVSPQRADIVVYLLPPQLSASPDNTNSAVHRIVGLPGEVVEVRDGQVLINEKPLDEPYLSQSAAINYEYGPETIPQDAYFVLGDNRNNAFDSHIWGMLPGELILGQAIGIFCPVERQNSLDSDVESDLNRETFDQIVDFFHANPALCPIQDF